MLATLWCHDHLVHFYQLAGMDWIDVLNALKADPRATSQLAQSLSARPMSSPGYFFDVQNRLKKFVDGGQLGIFRNGYWGHPQYKLSPEANLMGFAHYLEALDFQREIVKIHTIFGGKNPILTGSLAGCRARSISIKAARSGLSIWSASTGAVDHHPHRRLY